MKMLLVLISLIVSSSSINAASLNNDNVSVAEKKIITQAVEKLSKIAGKKLPIAEITKSPIAGVLQVTSGLNIFYVSADGKYMIFGDMVDVNKDRDVWSFTEKETRKLRQQALAAINDSDMIIFPATGNKIGTITVFTDIDCQYCRKMQENIAEYTEAGITVRYLSFPRAGPKSVSFEEAVKVWCAKDKAAAFNTAVVKKEFPKETCANNPVMMEYELGQKMGISGTPTIILDNGVKLAGVIDAQTLVKILKKN